MSNDKPKTVYNFRLQFLTFLYTTGVAKNVQYHICMTKYELYSVLYPYLVHWHRYQIG